MATFIARRIHDGFMSWDELKGKKPDFVKQVKEEYKKHYPDEEI